MNYAWEAALAADRCKVAREDVRYVPVRNGSPYTEIAQESLNNRDIDEGWVEINPLYRFSKEFSAMFDMDLEAYGKARALFFDVFMQYLIQIDLRQSLSRQEYALRFLLEELGQGVWGSRAARGIDYVKRHELRPLLCLIVKLHRCGCSIHLFREAMRLMYPDSLVYAGTESVRQVLVYVGVKETEEGRQRLTFLRDMFLPVYCEAWLFWEHHFGIIDVEETMELDETVLF
ncbi:MAG: hypothetical protein HFI91_13245 [Lachnospiraceae bacterium]|nr:hypothetical protein [Lachnospiraceae bacterium]